MAVARYNDALCSQGSIPYELAILAEAQRYQSWVFDMVRPYVGKRVLEIGAGIGNMSRWLPIQDRLILTEADPLLFEVLKRSVRNRPLPTDRICVELFNVATEPTERYISQGLDTIVSFNVLEHVKNDREVLRRLCDILKKGGGAFPRRLVTFVPAHPWAYGTLDGTFGHYRRYSAKQMRQIAFEISPEARLTVRYFNIFGLFGWVLNGKILRRRILHPSSIRVFEALCPIFRPIDDFLHDRLAVPVGQSLLTVLEWVE